MKPGRLQEQLALCVDELGDLVVAPPKRLKWKETMAGLITRLHESNYLHRIESSHNAFHETYQEFVWMESRKVFDICSKSGIGYHYYYFIGFTYMNYINPTNISRTDKVRTDLFEVYCSVTGLNEAWKD